MQPAYLLYKAVQDKHAADLHRAEPRRRSHRPRPGSSRASRGSSPVWLHHRIAIIAGTTLPLALLAGTAVAPSAPHPYTGTYKVGPNAKLLSDRIVIKPMVV